MLKLVLALAIPLSTVILVALFYLYQRARPRDDQCDLESLGQQDPDGTAQAEDLFVFQGGEDLTICDILEAPGEVIGKSNYGTLYKALLQRSSGLRLLRFLRPVCVAGTPEFLNVIEFLGSTKHPNLVPLLGFYSGPRGEKLLIFPFYRRGNLADFIRDASGESHRWSVICKVAIGIARGLDHLHTGLMRPMIHGNLKSRNILLDRNREPRISDFGLHLLLNPTAGQEMLDTLAVEGYKAPELIKMKEANGDTDIYSLGVILLELVTGKEPVNDKAASDGEFYLPNYLRNAVLGQRVSDLYHPGILTSNREDAGAAEERVLKMFQLGMACCSPSPSLRPNIKQVLRRLEEIGC